ncbi:MAG: sulfatase-like hydrolase/transferase, partial [Planctomycetaceae bacterium]|nr:sulfatase-like hydrolase/transferase [Planctomycetaceae bacterium]
RPKQMCKAKKTTRCRLTALLCIICTVLILPAHLTYAESTPATQQDTQPDIVVILADDQSYGDFGFMGNRSVSTPHLDQLAAESARFPNGYVPMSVCRPSLATFLTGLYPHQHGVYFNHPPPGLRDLRALSGEDYRARRQAAERLVGSLPTLPRLLARQGYQCLQTGKHWEGDYRNAGFTAGMTTGLPAADHDWLHGTRQQENGEWVAHGNGDQGLIIGRTTMQPIRDFVQTHPEDPLLIWYAPFLPHAPFDAPEKYHQQLADQSIPDHLRDYYAEIARFDATVGELRSILEEAGRSRNTVYVFASDNGFQPRTDGTERADGRSKLSVYENGLRTPILIHWPAKIPPADYPQVVQTIDLFPTILAIAGTENTEGPEFPGQNLLPAITGKAELVDRPAFGAIYPNDATSLSHPEQHANAVWCRSGNWKLVLSANGPNPLPSALYNLNEDPQEKHNLFGKPESLFIQHELTSLISHWWPYRDWELPEN